MIVGLTGKSCAGKDTIARMLPVEKFLVIDEDALGHQALESNHEKLREAFGNGIFSSDGRVDRKVLGPMVFSDPAKLEALNAITHPWMHDETLRIARGAEEKGLIPVINAALLESMGFVEDCDLIILAVAPYEVREARAMKRDGMTKEKFRDRAASQKDIGLSLFSSGRRVITIVNDGAENSLRLQLSFLCAKI